MSVFQDPRLAESVGYNTGHAHGHALGLEQGYTNGWNAATIHSENVIAERDGVIARLHDSNAHLQHQLAQMQQHLELQHEQAQSLRADYDGMHKAFLGVVAIATPAMKIVAHQPLEDRHTFIKDYGDNAYKLQGRDYVTAHRFPHNQPLVKQYLSIGHHVIDQTIEQVRRLQTSPAPGAAATA